VATGPPEPETKSPAPYLRPVELRGQQLNRCLNDFLKGRSTHDRINYEQPTDSTGCGRPADPAASRPDQPHHPDRWNPAPRDDNGSTVIPLRQNQSHTVILKPSQRPEASR
jgi:hypothetical protein